MATAHAASDSAYAETKLLKDMRRRVAAHTQEAAVANMHAEALEAECAQLHARITAAEGAHSTERATLSAELADLRVKCSLRVKAASDAAAQAEAAQQARHFMEQQLESLRAQAAEAATAARTQAAAAEERAGKLEAAARVYELEAEQQHGQIEELKTSVERLTRQVLAFFIPPMHRFAHLYILPAVSITSGPERNDCVLSVPYSWVYSLPCPSLV